MKFGARLVYGFLKHIFNPLVLRSAGSRHSPFAVVQHIGRRSGKTYSTPVIVIRDGDMFLFALTYGPQVDWYQNVLVAGQCDLQQRGQMFRLVAPSPLESRAAIPAFPLLLRWILRMRRTEHFFTMTLLIPC